MQHTLTVTREVADYLAALDAQAQPMIAAAQQALAVKQAVFTAVLRSQGITQGSLVSLDGTALVIDVPDAP